MTSKNILEADSMVASYDGRTVLHNVYIRIEQGEVVGLLGRNGCGKSTLLKSIFGSHEPEHKTVRINGEWIRSGYIHSRVTMLPQDDMIPENIRLRTAMKLFEIDESTFADQMPEIIPLLDQHPSQLSGGERRLFELLLVLHSKSQFCLLDEPFTGLSPIVVERIIEIMKGMKQKKGILITDHRFRSVTACSDRIYCFDQGRLFEVVPENPAVR